MKKVSRSLHLVTASGAVPRDVTYKGRPYIAIPVVALVEGVIHPINAEEPEYVTVESYSLAYETWNGRPVFPGHPVRGGTQVLGNVPEILESEQFGIVFNAGVVDDKLTMEAWINKEDAEAVGDAAVEIYDRAASSKPIEISVGAVVLMEEIKGTYNNQKYNGKWIEVFSDHLALLPADDIGACSISMGCGVRTATVHRITAKGYELVPREEDALPAEKKKEEVVLKKRSLLQRMGALLRTASPAGFSSSDVSSELLDALEEVEPRMKYNGWIVDTYDNEGLVIYCMYDEAYDMDLYVRDFKWDGKTAVIGTLYAEVKARTVYEIEDDENQANEVLVTQLRAAQKLEPKTAAAPCGCGANKPTTAVTAVVTGESGMKTRAERIVALIAASAALIAAGKKARVYAESDTKWLTEVPDNHFAVLEESVEIKDPPAAVIPPVAAPVATTAAPVAATTTELTEEQLLKVMPAHMKRSLARAQAQEVARKGFLKGRLKTAQSEYTEAQLETMDIDELERMARMLKVNGPVDTDADYSLMGAPRETFATGDGAPPPPDMNASIRTMRTAQKK